MLNKSDHGFRYYTSDNRGGPTGGPRTNTQPGPARKAAEAAAAAAGSRDGGGLQRSGRPGSSRVRVAAGAGDKCVPPAKSKPKKRKAVREGEGPSIGMECVDWSEEMYSVGQLVSAFGHRLPVIAKVCAGCSDDFGTALQVDQM
ncbi:hypothetical protein CAPTEDRAFT_220022 [Capitella teleta]|uniref:Uncharacterized protein n=1 Tax=Capitella teleta TaxID=283909 RepID=R7ULP5_CAPTE|nr:hypothetical protein CAPTEDRAFT_220022 [Capitella teleta]|eukprot:ELU07115.1 hypothetical protein CAPTEDRAFT_220022 [Capitella teleta]